MMGEHQSDVHLEEGHIEIKARNSKTRVRRMIPISDNLRRWLCPLAQPSGPVFPFLRLHKLYEKLPRKTGVPWKRNGLRHSFSATGSRPPMTWRGFPARLGTLPPSCSVSISKS
jgi:hypothetical protein